MRNNPAVFIENLESRRAETRISIAELCRRADVHPTTFTRIKNGAVQPTLDTMCRLADALEVRIGDLFGTEKANSEFVAGYAAAVETLETSLRSLRAAG